MLARAWNHWISHEHCCCCCCLLSRFSRVQPCGTPQTAAHQAPLPLGLSRQEHWSGLPLPSPVQEIASENIKCYSLSRKQFFSFLKNETRVYHMIQQLHSLAFTPRNKTLHSCKTCSQMFTAAFIHNSLKLETQMFSRRLVKQHVVYPCHGIPSSHNREQTPDSPQPGWTSGRKKPITKVPYCPISFM